MVDGSNCGGEDHKLENLLYEISQTIMFSIV